MKRITLLLVAMLFGFGALYAQTITIKNQTCYDVMFYSGTVVVGGTSYLFGSESPGVSVQNAGTTGTYSISGSLPGYSGPPTGTTSYVGFKVRIPGIVGPYTASGYASAAAPFTMTGATDPAGCNSGNPFTLVWTGPAANPVVYILP